MLRELSCSVEHNSRIGLIGPNGCGKSTLIKIILGALEPTEGTVSIARKCRIAYLPQNMQLDPNLVMIDYIMCSRTDIKEIWQRIDRLSSQLHNAHDDSTESLLKSAINKFQEIGGFEHENEVKYVLSMLDLPESVWKKSIGSFSGGEQTRICLASILLAQFDVLIMDEPTNHLDIGMISWLEKYLNKLDKPFLLVSHDRTFLDNSISSIFYLEEGRISITKGNYSSFRAARDIALMSQERQYERQQKWLSETQEFIRRNMGSQKTAQAKSRLKQIQKTEIINRPKHIKSINLRINSSGRSGNDVYVLEEARLGVAGNLLAEEVNLFAHYQDRICVVGPNGCGKTTLLKTLLGELPILDGNLKIGASLDIGYYDQHQIDLDGSITVKETLWQIVPDATNGYILSWLARFGFKGDDVEKLVSVLSGGEKSRLYLSVLIHQSPNLLILDEPTNHLDIEMSDSLLVALKEYNGTIIFVSHDRYFIRELATKAWVFRKKAKHGQIYTSIDEFTTDIDLALELSFEVPELEKSTRVLREKKKKVNPWQLQKLHVQIEEIQDSISLKEKELEKIHMQLASSDTYNDSGRVQILQLQMQETETKIFNLKMEIQGLEDKYLELSYENS